MLSKLFTETNVKYCTVTEIDLPAHRQQKMEHAAKRWNPMKGLKKAEHTVTEDKKRVLITNQT